MAQAIDDSPKTGYETTLSTPYPGQWFQVELPATSAVTAIEMDAVESPKSFAKAYSVQVSDDGENWGKPIVTGIGEPDARINLMAPVTAKFVRITLTGKQGWQKWAINSLDFYGEEGM